MTLHGACKHIRNMYVSQHNSSTKTTKGWKNSPLRLRDNPLRLHNVSTEEDAQINNLRRIQYEAWKLLPDDSKKIWNTNRKQEKSIINGIPEMLWNQMTKEDKDAYTPEWEKIKDSGKSDWVQTREIHTRRASLVESVDDLEEEEVINESIFEDEKIAQAFTSRSGLITTTNVEDCSVGLLSTIIGDISRTLAGWFDTFNIFL